MGHDRRNPLRDMRVQEVIGACFPCDEILLTYPLDIVLLYRGWELCTVPRQALREILVEEMHLFCRGGGNIGVFCQVVIKRCCASSLRTNDDEVRHQPYWIRHCPI